MYKHYFKQNGRLSMLLLPFEISELVKGWANLRKTMLRSVPEQFIRDEWAYLISFLDSQNLYQSYNQAFGEITEKPETAVDFMVQSRGRVALWLPNNVSLLGPLMLILLSLSGNVIRIKAGSRSQDLTAVFLDFVLENLPQGQLKNFLNQRVKVASFDRNDPRNKEMATESHVRLVFGSDESAQAIDSLPHPVNSTGIYFTDKQSQVWLDKEAISENTIETLIKVFYIYGQAGCTSPRKVVIIDGDEQDTLKLRARIIKAWSKVIPRRQPQHIASGNIMARQWAAALGWRAELTESNGAVIAAGGYQLPLFSSFMSLPIVFGSLEKAAEELPDNIQTIGHNFSQSKTEDLLPIVAGSQVKRLVPIARMHHFGPVWDGYEFFRQLFKLVEVG